MESLRHLRLLLWKDFTLKRRHPIVLIIELLWPAMLMIPLITFRHNYLPEVHNAIWFGARALPSAGLIPFMQGIMCDPNAQLRDSHRSPDSRAFSEFNPRLSDFVQNVTRLVENPEVTWENVARLANDIERVSADEHAMGLAYEKYKRTGDVDQFEKDLGLPRYNENNGYILQDLLLNRSEFDRFLVHRLNFSEQQSRALMQSSFHFESLQKQFVVIGLELQHCLSLSDLASIGSCYISVKNSLLGDFLTTSAQNLGSLLFLQSDPSANQQLKLVKAFFSYDTVIRDTACSNGSDFRNLFTISPATLEAGVQSRLCHMSDQQASALSDEFQSQLTIGQVNDIATKIGNSSSLYVRFINDYTKLMNDYQPFSEFGDYVAKVSKANPNLVELQPLRSLFRTPGDVSDTSSLSPDDFLRTAKGKQAGLDVLCNVLCGARSARCRKAAGKGKAPLKAASESKARTEPSVFDRLLQGFKILYAPNTTMARKIIEEANRSMNSIESLKQVSLQFLNESAKLNATLQQIVNESSAYNSTISFLSSGCQLSTILSDKNATATFLASGGSAAEGLQALLTDVPLIRQQIGLANSNQTNSFPPLLCQLFQDRFGNATFFEALRTMADSLTEALNSVNVDLWMGFEDEASLIEYAGDATKNKSTIWAGIVFTNLGSENDTTLPKHVEYKIKMNKTMVYPTYALKDKFWIPGPRRHDYDLQYVVFGFVYIQDMIDRGITNVHLNSSAVEPGAYIQQFPYPCYIDDRYARAISTTLPLFMALAWVFSVAMITRGIVYEKEKRLRVIMKVMGLNSVSLWASWFLISLALLTVVSLTLSLLMKYGLILMNSNVLLVFLFFINYALATISLCCLISTLFNYANLAACSAGIIYLFSYLPSIIYSHYELELTFSEKGLLCLLSSTAFSAAASHVARFEELGTGIQWNNMGKSLINGDSFSFLSANMFLLIDAAVYLLMTAYIDNVFPGQYGIPQPWYFPFLPSYWTGKGRTRDKAGQYTRLKEDAENDEEDHEESVSSSLKIGVGIQGLVKLYSGKKVAVSDLTVNFYEGQVSCLLGQNGAGKTTTLSVLTGVFPPSAGTVFVHGLDVRKHARETKKIVGVCPQHSVLFESLTVAEHLWFFAKIKGAEKAEVTAEIDRWIDDLDLTAKRNVRVSRLSGGMQRKLCVAMAYVAHSKVVILDEPTSGVDAYSRRGIWDLIAQNRTGRTVILSTHYMNEADVLGDRIAIMACGKLRCVGSPRYLKRKFSDGFHLTITKRRREAMSSLEDSDSANCVELITEFVKSHVSDARLIGDVGTEVSFLIPAHSTRNGLLSGLLVDMESRGNEIGILNFGLSASPLEEVFLKVTKQSPEDMGTDATTGYSFVGKLRHLVRRRRQEEHVQQDKDQDSAAESQCDGDVIDEETQESHNADSCGTPGRCTISGRALYWQQFKSLYVKNVLHTKRFVKGFLAQIVLPVVFVSVALFLRMLSSDPEEGTLLLTPALYPSPNYFPFENYRPEEARSTSLTSTIAQPCGPLPHYSAQRLNVCLSETTSDIWKSMRGNRSDNASCWCDGGQSFCPSGIQLPMPSQLKTVDGLMTLQNMSGKVMSEYIKETTRFYRYKRYGGVTFGNENPSYLSTNQTLMKSLGLREAAKAWFNNKGYHTMPSYLNALDNVILRSYLNFTESPLEYGISTYSDPFESTSTQLIADKLASGIDVLIAVCVIFALAFVPPSFILILIQERVRGAKHLQLVSGVHPVIYWLSNYAWHLCNYLVTVVCISIVFFAFQEDVYTTAEDFSAVVALLLLYGWAMIPLVYPVTFLFRDESTAYVMTFSITLLIGLCSTLATYIYQLAEQMDEKYVPTSNLLQSLFLIFPNYCLGRGLMDISYRYYIKKVNSQLDAFGLGLTVSDLLALKKQAIGRNLLAMGIEGFAFFAAVLLIEYGFFARKPSKGQSMRPQEQTIRPPKEDDDVERERKDVIERRASDYVLMLDQIGKTYRSRFPKKVCSAVNDLCVAVSRGECFGLLGVNGAGKTTTFKILTGDILASGGDAYVLGHSVTNQLSECRKHIGYCPQTDSVYDLLTGREHLTLYAHLKGIDRSEIPQAVTWCLRKLALTRHADVSAGKYSGGNKRKLSTALALIGQPDILLLDEPTTGMDPKSRRFLWSVIHSLVNQGKSVVLTSHSMEECEALCSRIGILVNGSLCCLGSPQHLKNKFGDVYTIVLRCRTSESTPDLSSVKKHIGETFPAAELKDEHHSFLEYHVPICDTSLGCIFSELEKSAADLNIEDYTVSQTTMDQVFVNFAKLQRESDETATRETSFLSRVRVSFNARRQVVAFTRLSEEGGGEEECL